MDEKWALVTGGTGGLGGEICKSLLRLGYHLLVVGRDKERLSRCSTTLSAHRINANQCIVEVCVDLQHPQAVHDIMMSVGDKNLRTVILAAADYVYGTWNEIPPERHMQLIQCNIVTTANLMQRLLVYMDGLQHGQMLVIGSLGALMPTPYQAAYTSSKAWLHQFVAALQAERRNSCVTLTLGCPGGMRTRMLLDSPAWTRLRRYPWVRLSILSPQKVSAILLRAMFAKRYRIIPGKLNWCTAMFMQYMPHAIGILLGRVLYGHSGEV